MNFIATRAATVLARRPASAVTAAQLFRPSLPRYPHCTLKHRTLTLTQVRCVDYEESDYLHHSSVPTMSFQDHLPPLPIPNLDESCRLFLQALSPLLLEQEKESAKHLVSEFAAGVGKELQQQLESLPSTFAEEFSLRGRVLANRTPLPIFGMYGCEAIQLRGDNQISKAARYVQTCLKFDNTLKANKLRPDVWDLKPQLENALKHLKHGPKPVMYEGKKVLPLSMNNYRLLFNSCQIAKFGKDELREYEGSKHIVVMRNGHIYTMDVIDEDGRRASTSQIYKQLKQIVDETNSAADIPVAVLTTTDRDTCARAMQKLRARNERSLNLVESAIVVLCLDDNEANTDKDIIETIQFGDGGNRWYGKNNIVVGKNGYIGMTCHEFMADGKVYIRFSHELTSEMLQSSFTYQDGCDISKCTISRLDFDVDSDLLSEVNEAKKKFSFLGQHLPFHQVICDDFDYSLIKKRKLSPDFLGKLTSQLAFYAMRGRLPYATDVVATAFYKEGRFVESPIVTRESAAFVNAVAVEMISDKKRLFDLMTAASLSNQLRVFDTIQSKMFNFHFAALEHLAEQSGVKVPFFASKLYEKTKFQDFSISTVDSGPEFAILTFAYMEYGGTWGLYQQVAKSPGKLRVISCFPEAPEYLSHFQSSLVTVMDVVKNGATKA
ncbi:carnitine O-palmitoyltransferase 2, mitochondrial-like [Corticium candelabrum]|uniref:carnitine O-palmitoyltransferase 2, mitochondrial-like n=1 Tax=Corticium candelabrum TaxID=121492 RepID=UPI002E25956C|nr:carnitine O-palmitoyltransferase 2, mitochondrial-like [Corticium candelabrum]